MIQLPLPIAILNIDSIALILDRDGNVIDEAFNWETVENIAMHDFDCVEVIALSGDPNTTYFYTTVEELQAMANSRLADRRDCFGEDD